MYNGKFTMMTKSDVEILEESQWIQDNYLSALAFIMTNGECKIGEHVYKYVSPLMETYVAKLYKCDGDNYCIYHGSHRLTSSDGTEYMHLSAINNVDSSDTVWYAPMEYHDKKQSAGLELLWVEHNIIEAASFIIFNSHNVLDLDCINLKYAYNYVSSQGNTFKLKSYRNQDDKFTIYYDNSTLTLELGTVSISDLSVHKAQWYSCSNSEVISAISLPVAIITDSSYKTHIKLI